MIGLGPLSLPLSPIFLRIFFFFSFEPQCSTFPQGSRPIEAHTHRSTEAARCSGAIAALAADITRHNCTGGFSQIHNCRLFSGPIGSLGCDMRSLLEPTNSHDRDCSIGLLPHPDCGFEADVSSRVAPGGFRISAALARVLTSIYKVGFPTSTSWLTLMINLLLRALAFPPIGPNMRCSPDRIDSLLHRTQPRSIE